MFSKRFFLFWYFLYSISLKAESCLHKWTMIPTMSGIHMAIPLCATASDYGAIGDGRADDTVALMKAFSSGGMLDLEGKKYLINIGINGLLPSNSKIIQGNGAEIILKPNNLPLYNMISLVNRSNVKIYDLKLTGDVRNHRGTSGEWGMGFEMRACKNCELHRVEANEMWGDGFYLGAFGQKTNEGGGIFNSSARANRRVGISIARCKNFIVKDSNFIDTGSIKRDSPSYGIDIEPNPDDYDSIEGLKLINIKTINNYGGGILFVPRHLASSTNPNALYNLYIENFVSKNDGSQFFSSCHALRFVERYSENINGSVIIKIFKVLNLTGGIPFSWERTDTSTLTVDAFDLSIDGVTQYDYHY